MQGAGKSYAKGKKATLKDNINFKLYFLIFDIFTILNIAQRKEVWATVISSASLIIRNYR